MTEEGATICGREGCQGVGHGTHELFSGAGCCLTQMRFEFGKRRFDRIEVGAIRRQIAQFDASGPQKGFHPMDFVRGQIVQNQRVARMQARHEHSLEIHQKDLGIQRPIHQKRSGDLFVAQGRQKRRTLPMTVGEDTSATFALGAAAIQTGQLGMEARFVNKH